MTRPGKFGLVVLVILAVIAIGGPIIAPDPLAPDMARGALLSPSAAHWLGTDQFSRDIFARLAAGARISLAIGIIAVLVAAVIGTSIGLAAGVTRGMVSQGLGRIIDLGLALPRLIVLLVVLSAVGAMPVALLAVLLGATGWPAVARLVRGETRRLRHAPFVIAARALGAPQRRVVWRDILPDALPAVLVASTLGLADAILLEAGLSFIGVGVRAPHPSWGGMLFEAREYIATAPWLLVMPSLALVAATSAATLLGDALRRSLQPDIR